jgi:hypothetical protein
MIYTRTIRFAQLFCVIWLSSGPTLAQVEPERVQLILSKLPPPQSATYKAIKKVAGNVTSQALPLTKSEIWSVPRANLDGVRSLAAQLGVAVKYPGEQQASDDATARRLRGPIPEASREPRENWSHIFRSAPADIKINDKQKQMLELAKASKSTVGVELMEAPIAPMMEYALTREADTRSASKDSAKITVALGQNTTLTILRTGVDIKPDFCIWRGKVEGTEAPATIMWWPDGKMAGSVQHRGRLYSIRHLGGELHAVVEMSEDQMPQEHASMPARMRTGDRSLREDPLVNEGDASILRRAAAEPPGGSRSKAADMKGQITTGSVSHRKDTPVKLQKVKSALPTTIVIDVMFAYTKAAAAHYADVKRELIELSVEEANESFRLSNLGHIKLRLVHAYQTDYVEEGEHFNHLWRFADRGDGHMEEVHRLRDRYKADVAVLIVDDANGCGLATRVFADADEAFAVVHHECAANTYSVAHEIGHIIGARHDLATDKNLSPFPYGHGYVHGTKWRDIMSYKNSCGGCPRIPVWSSPTVMVKGDPAGTPSLDNARVLSEQAARIAAFR